MVVARVARAQAGGVAFEEVVVPLDLPETKASIGRCSPSGRVPALQHGDRLIWDSLADAFFTPVVGRFQTYGVPLQGVAQAYAAAIWEHPLTVEWRKLAERSP